MAPDANNASLPYGSRWLHLWIASTDQVHWPALAMQYEQVGISISAAPYVLMPATSVRLLLRSIASLPGVKSDGASVSIPIVGEGD